MVFAASSLTETLPKVAEAWRKSSGSKVIFSFDGSSRLAKQIKEGAPADLYFSAHPIWMDYLEEESLLLGGTRTNLLGNQLVLAIPKGRESFSWGNLPRLGMAGESVPAGIYGKTALQNEGQWDLVKRKIIRGTNVRTVLGWLELGAIPAGIVYKTDTVSPQAKIEVAHVFPQSSHPSIVYPMAVIKRSKAQPLAKEFLAFCRSQQALDIFVTAGFKLVK